VTFVASPCQIDQAKILTGLVGRDILASRSPWLHEQEAMAQGLDLDYTLFDFAARGWDEKRLSTLLEEVETAGYAGLNITHPFKQAVMPLLDALSSDAQQVGAVNTVSLVDGRRIGHNTDVTGFAESFRSGLQGVARQHVVQAGAGGAGAATAHALLSEGVERISIFDMDKARLNALVEKLQLMFGEGRAAVCTEIPLALHSADGFINATPMGMARYPGSPLALDLLSLRHWVADIVYFPLETALLKHARQMGCRVLDGSGMVTNQAATAFEIFTGLPAQRERMRASFANYGAGRGEPEKAKDQPTPS
jgi:shikimate dehydrogenase